MVAVSCGVGRTWDQSQVGLSLNKLGIVEQVPGVAASLDLEVSLYEGCPFTSLAPF